MVLSFTVSRSREVAGVVVDDLLKDVVFLFAVLLVLEVFGCCSSSSGFAEAARTWFFFSLVLLTLLVSEEDADPFFGGTDFADFKTSSEFP